MSPKYVLSVSAGIASCFQQIPLVGHTALGQNAEWRAQELGIWDDTGVHDLQAGAPHSRDVNVGATNPHPLTKRPL